MRATHVLVPLSKLYPGRTNPRRVKPKPESDRRLLASIQAFGLLEPLIVRPVPEDKGAYQIIAGHRRLKALREIHKGTKPEPKVRCERRDVDDATAAAMALSENVDREGMHALDEAEAFSRLAADEAKGVDVIASSFGVTERYVRQRMKLAGLAKVVKTAFRQDAIDIGTAEAFASIPENRQLDVWNQMNGHVHHAEHVRNIIKHEWIDASHALFDVTALPDSGVSRDLFSERVLIERNAFMTAQTDALSVEKAALVEDGWCEVVAGPYEAIHDLPLKMDTPEREFDPEVAAKLEKLAERRQKLETRFESMLDSDVKGIARIGAKAEALDAERQEIESNAMEYYSEATKSIATLFLILYPDGQVRREVRVPRQTLRHSTGVNGEKRDGEAVQSPQPPTSDDLNERQLADTFTHQTLLVREALLKAPSLRKRVLALILHGKVRAEALAIRHEANAVTLHAGKDGFVSASFECMKEKRAAIDPFESDYSIADHEAFQRLVELPDARINQLIDLLTVELVTAHLQRRTELVHQLSTELKIDFRRSWRPDTMWLSGYQKIQLSHLLAEVKGPVYSPARETRKKSELV